MHTNLAARAGRWSAAHWKTATFGWIALVVAAVALGTVVGGKQLTDAENANGEAARAEHILAHAGFANIATESVLVQSSGTARPDAVTRDVSAMLRARTDVKNVKTPVRSKDEYRPLLRGRSVPAHAGRLFPGAVRREGAAAGRHHSADAALVRHRSRALPRLRGLPPPLDAS